MCLVLGQCHRKDQNVVQIHYCVSSVRTQYLVHHTHECGQGACQTERDDLVLIKAVWRYKRRLVAVIRVYPYLVISTGQIQLSKDPCPMEFIQ